jgi:hypothetical protein
MAHESSGVAVAPVPIQESVQSPSVVLVAVEE